MFAKQEVCVIKGALRYIIAAEGNVCNAYVIIVQVNRSY